MATPLGSRDQRIRLVSEAHQDYASEDGDEAQQLIGSQALGRRWSRTARYAGRIFATRAAHGNITTLTAIFREPSVGGGTIADITS
jgi:hypothetical protein